MTRSPGYRRRGSLVRSAARVIALSLVAIAAVGAQVPVRDTVAEARQLHDAGSLKAVEELLRPYLENHPDNGDAARILAQTLYWLKRPSEARTMYEAALVRHPEDITLRLDYGRMLVETSDRTRARELLAPLRGSAESRGRAELLLGTLAYWNGDYTAAARLFREALRADSSQRDARRQLGEILMVTAPRIQAAADLRHDDQTLDRISGDVHASWNATPLLRFTTRVRQMQFHLGDTVTRGLTAAEVGLSHFAPAARLETEVAGGWLQRLGGTSSDWTGRVGLGLRFPQHVTLRVRAEREPYLYTLASVSTPVMTQTIGTTLDLDSHGWLGQIAANSERYPDANAVSTAFVWLLAPLVNTPEGQLQIGYSAAAQNADDGRYVLANPTQPYQPGDPRFNTLGVYAPYYTPNNLLAQSVLGAFAVHPGGGVEVHASGALGIRATDDAPQYKVVTRGAPPSPTVELSYHRRVSALWNVRGSLGAPLSEGWRLDISGESGRTAFYTYTTASVQLTYTFVAAARRRAERY